MWREFNMCLAMTTWLQNMNYECGRVKDDGMNFEVKHPQVLKIVLKT
jgi:hypothetical protein